MREILFRGKTDTGKWVYGDLSQHKTGKKFIKCGSAISSFEVIPETIGQFTGLTDKNGKKIFEDDVVKVTDDNGETNLCSCGIGCVIFYYGSWYIDEEVNDGLYDVSNIYYLDVIGNIHDNPELLSGDSDVLS